MSRLSQLLRRATSGEGPSLGFGLAGQRPRASLLVIARLDGRSPRLPTYLPQGADALLVEGEVTAALGRELKALPGLPWGALLPAASAAALDPLREAGMDFLAFDPTQSEAALLLAEGLGLVALASPEASDSELRLLEALSLTALLAPPPALPLTVAGRLALQRLGALTRLPLLVPLPQTADATLLRLLRDAGAAAVVVDAALGPAALSALREAIEALPPRPRRREERGEALLPMALLPRPGAEEGEEEGRARLTLT